MSIIQQKIRNTGDDAIIKISIGSDVGFLGNQQEIDKLTQFTGTDLVNPTIDSETRKFKLVADVPVATFQFYFDNTTGLDFIKAGFTQQEIDGNTQSMLNSFFILEFYDTFDAYTQIKIFTTYLTKIGKKPEYKISESSNNQLYYWYVPESFMRELTGSTYQGYIKLTFYNSKTGTITPLYNVDKAGISTLEKMYFNCQLNLVNRTWRITNTTITNTLRGRKLDNATKYIERVENTFEKTDNKQQLYPTGNTYSKVTNTYFTT